MPVSAMLVPELAATVAAGIFAPELTAALLPAELGTVGTAAATAGIGRVWARERVLRSGQ
jgi:hypothetical protein